jgi:hypothetical protein
VLEWDFDDPPVDIAAWFHHNEPVRTRHLKLVNSDGGE